MQCRRPLTREPPASDTVSAQRIEAGRPRRVSGSVHESLRRQPHAHKRKKRLRPYQEHHAPACGSLVRTSASASNRTRARLKDRFTVASCPAEDVGRISPSIPRAVFAFSTCCELFTASAANLLFVTGGYPWTSRYSQIGNGSSCSDSEAWRFFNLPAISERLPRLFTNADMRLVV